jgi:hypothetical protein
MFTTSWDPVYNIGNTGITWTEFFIYLLTFGTCSISSAVFIVLFGMDMSFFLWGFILGSAGLFGVMTLGVLLFYGLCKFDSPVYNEKTAITSGFFQLCVSCVFVAWGISISVGPYAININKWVITWIFTLFLTTIYSLMFLNGIGFLLYGGYVIYRKNKRRNLDNSTFHNHAELDIENIN